MNLKDYFSFTRGEKRGALVLLLIISLLIIANLSIGAFKKDQPIDLSQFETAIKEFETEVAFSKKSSNQESISLELFEFNPNIIDDEEWKKLGFKDWQIKTINKYKAKGGNWKSKADVAKIYGLETAHFEQLKPFILLPDSYTYKPKKFIKTEYKSTPVSKKIAKPLIININQADTNDLKQLRGIGSGFANRIIKYRNSLGGYVRIDQLKEVYGLKEETYNAIKNNIELTESSISQVNINTSYADSLIKHPYINWKIANAIVKYRKAHGDYIKVSELKKLHLISDDTYIKISPYLKVN